MTVSHDDTPPAVTQVADGRRLVRERNRELVVDALLAWFREGNFQPSTGAIAERAGLSPRSLFRYFEDVEDLHRATVERQMRRALPLAQIPADPADPTADKVAALVASRARLYEEIGPAARAGRFWATRQPAVAEQLRSDRGRLRELLVELFAPELHGAQPTLLAALDVVTSFDAWDLLRTDQRLGRREATEAMSSATIALLAAA